MFLCPGDWDNTAAPSAWDPEEGYVEQNLQQTHFGISAGKYLWLVKAPLLGVRHLLTVTEEPCETVGLFTIIHQIDKYSHI